MKCVILCAGKSTRMNSNLPKVLLPLNGKPLLYHVMEMWGCEPKDFIFVLGYKAGEVIKSIPEESVVAIQDFQNGIADAILQAEGLIKNEKFVVALGDCIQKGRWSFPKMSPMLGVGVWETDNHEAIKSSYSVELENGYVSKVIEKPKKVANNYCGMGTYFLDGRVFEYIRETPISPLRSEVEITDTIQLMINSGERVTPIFFKGEYLNITYLDDIQIAERILK